MKGCKGLSLISLLVGIAIAGIVAVGVGKILMGSAGLMKVVESTTVSDKLIETYRRYLRDESIISASLAHADNENLALHLQSGDVNATVPWSAFALYRATGQAIVPKDGLYFDIHGAKIENPAKARWHVTAKWRGLKGNTYELDLGVDDMVGSYHPLKKARTFSGKSLDILEPAKMMKCVYVTTPRIGGPCTGRMCPNENDYATPGFFVTIQSQYLLNQLVHCPSGFQMQSVEVLQGCHSKLSGSYVVNANTGKCFAGIGAAVLNCEGREVRMACRARCCRYP